MSEYGTIQCDLFQDYNFEFDKMEISWDELIDGTATSTWINDGYVEMKALVQNDRVARQTKQYFITKTGKFKRCLFTMVLNLIEHILLVLYMSFLFQYMNHQLIPYYL